MVANIPQERNWMMTRRLGTIQPHRIVTSIGSFAPWMRAGRRSAGRQDEYLLLSEILLWWVRPLASVTYLLAAFGTGLAERAQSVYTAVSFVTQFFRIPTKKPIAIYPS
jgi:hypothetical protein